MSRLPEDPSLLAAFRAGDRKAMETVYRHYAPLLSALVFRGLTTQSGRVRPMGPFEVGTVVQEAFTRAFQDKARQTYDGQSPFLGYLAAVARNFLLNERRLREESSSPAALEVAINSRLDAVALSCGPRAPDQAVEETELNGLVERFLDERTQSEREVFKARFVHRWTQDETASVVKLSRIQVRRIEAHLREDLLARFKQSGYLERVTTTSSLLGTPEPQ